MNLRRRLRNVRTLFRWTPRLLRDRRLRRLLRQMAAFCRQLPAIMRQPLPDAMRAVEPNAGDPLLDGLDEQTIRGLADLAALLERRSVPGICLRRSLTRYRYLRQLDLPLTVVFGATLTGDRAQRSIAGHAWLEQDGRPYHEAAENVQGYTPMFRWPPSTRAPAQADDTAVRLYE